LPPTLNLSVFRIALSIATTSAHSLGGINERRL